MKVSWLCSFGVICATSALAQTATPAQQPASPPTPTISMTGCVAAGSDSKPITLTNAMVLPAGSAAVQPEPSSTAPLPDRPAVSTGATQQGTATSLGTIDIGSASLGAGTAGTIARHASPVGTGGIAATSASVSGTAPAGSSASSVGGYRLSGADLASWVGRRVQITGMVVPSTEPPAAVAPGEPGGAAPMPTLRVLTLQPITGPCPK